MALLSEIRSWFASRKPQPPSQWFHVEFDESLVVMRATPPAKQSWDQSFPWSSVTRVCFKDEGPFASDGIYVFTSLRPESFVVPIEANGGDAFFQALVARGLFPEDLAGKAITSTDGGLYCWPLETPRDAGA